MMLLQVLYLLLPAYFSNMAPVIVRNCCTWMAIPIDFNKRLNGKPIFGKNKTVRGFVFGILFSILIAFIQFIVFKAGFLKGLTVIDYNNWLLIGILFGFGALSGDAIESFIKRRINIKPGSSFIPFDQIDHVLGALLLISFEVKLSLQIWIIAIAATFFLHILINFLAYFLKMRDTLW
jgi:CDP-2,3-bis-(O-geranylgeranyl)-sn-glycerol synthase